MRSRSVPATPTLVAAGALFAFSPLIRPWGDTSAGGEQAAFASIAHSRRHVRL